MAKHCLAALALSAIAVAQLRADEIPVTSRVASVGLFKNGLAVVKRVVTAPGSGTFRLDDVPEPVHGTYWIESDVAVESAVQMREMDVPIEANGTNIQEELAGKKVTLHFRSEKLAPLSGTVLLPKKKTEETPRPLSLREYEYAYRPPVEQPNRFLILQTAKSRVFVDASEIAYYEAEGVAETVKRRKPVLLLTVEAGDKRAVIVTISYLAHGISWAPSYRVDISDPKRLSVEQCAVIKNEMAELKEAEVSLISGFPSIQFGNVLSPLSPHMSWTMFFQQLAQQPQRYHQMLSNTIAQQAAGPYGAQGPQVNLQPGGDGIDLHYHSIGKRTLAVGDSLALTTRKGQAEYQRIVEWLIPDTRDEFGNYLQHSRREEVSDDAADDAWDALKFKNPFNMPMTTGAAMVVANGRFSGQRMVNWVNAGEETTLRVNKALSIRTKAVEHEDQKGNGVAERDLIYIGGRRFRQATVRGELQVCNHRGEAINLLIRRRFSGDLTKADGEPKVQLREEGVYAVNKHNELAWSLTLKPGEEKSLTYQYTVLVSF
jgi:hypothetical protein